MSLPDIDSSRATGFFGAAAAREGPLVAGLVVLIVASRFFGASVPAGRFLFFWAPGAVKKDDMAAVCGLFLLPVVAVVAVVCAFGPFAWGGLLQNF